MREGWEYKKLGEVASRNRHVKRRKHPVNEMLFLALEKRASFLLATNASDASKQGLCLFREKHHDVYITI